MNSALETLRSTIERECVIASSVRPSLLPGGKQAAWTFDFKRLLLDADTLDAVSLLFLKQLEDIGEFQAGGLETSAIGLVAGICMKAKTEGRTVNGFYMRKSRKKDGLQRMIEGRLDEKPVVLFDDIMNTGRSKVKLIEQLDLLNKRVAAVCVVVRFREESYYEYLRERGIRIISLFTLDDFPETGGVAEYMRHAAERTPARLALSFKTNWKFAANDPDFFHVLPKSAPALDEERIYMGSDNGTMWALKQSDGSVVWKHSTLFGAGKKRLFSSPLVHEGIVYFGAYDGNIYALDAKTGVKRWVNFEADWIGSSPCVAPDLGLIYIGLEFGLFNKQGGISAFDVRTGKKRWVAYSPSLTHSSPAYSQKHRIVVVGSSYGSIYAHDAENGRLLWEFNAGAAVRASFAFDEKRGLVCFGSEDRFFYVLKTKTGELVHKVESLDGFCSTPLVHEGKAYIGCLDKRVLCVDLEKGSIRWVIWTGGRVLASPALIDGSIFIGSNDGQLYELDPETGKEKGFLQLTERIVNKIAYDPSSRTFFVPTHANELYALRRKDHPTATA